MRDGTERRGKAKWVGIALAVAVFPACVPMPRCAPASAVSLEQTSLEIAVHPACLGLLATKPNGDALVSAVTVVADVPRACRNSAQLDARAVKIDDGWLVVTDEQARVATRYRLVEKGDWGLYVVQVRQNFGGAMSTDELLVVRMINAPSIKPDKRHSSEYRLEVIGRMPQGTSASAASELMRQLQPRFACVLSS
jgi:hypothetical protein